MSSRRDDYRITGGQLTNRRVITTAKVTTAALIVDITGFFTADDSCGEVLLDIGSTCRPSITSSTKGFVLVHHHDDRLPFERSHTHTMKESRVVAEQEEDCFVEVS